MRAKVPQFPASAHVETVRGQLSQRKGLFFTGSSWKKLTSAAPPSKPA